MYERQPKSMGQHMTKIALRNIWFQFHKWIGLLLAILIIPLCVSGFALVWHDALDEAVNPQRFAISGTEAQLSPAAYAQAAASVLEPGERIASIQMKAGEPVIVTAARPAPKTQQRGRPVRTLVWIDPPTGKVLDSAGSNEGLVRVLHNLHGNLMVPGIGRQIVGWVGVAMLISSISGLWLWWPTAGSLARAFRWKRHRNVDTNLHHQFGFWIALPLFVLSLTGVWISFPSFFGAISGDARTQSAGGPQAMMARMRAQPLGNPAQSINAVVKSAATLNPGPVQAIEWPTDQKPEWTLSYAGKTKPGSVTVEDASGIAKAAKERPQQPETTARLMRRIHDGTGMGAVWQVIIFLGGVLPTTLAVTGVIMWWRARGWRGELAARQKAKKVTTA